MPGPVEATREAFIADLRSLADFFENTPDLPCPYMNMRAVIYTTADKFAATASALGGERKKEANDDYYSVVRQIGGAVVEVYTARDEVCARVQVGTQTVEVEEIVTPAVTRTVTVTEPVYEWECSPILGSSAA